MYNEYKMNARDEKEELRFDWVPANTLRSIFCADYIFQIYRITMRRRKRLILHEDKMRAG